MKVLLIDDDFNLSKVLKYQIESNGYDVQVANNGTDGLKAFSENDFGVVISDIRMPDISGIDVLKKIRAVNESVVFILITAHGSVDDAIDACKMGADDYITKPFGQEQLLFVLEKAIRLRSLEQENVQLRAELSDKYHFENLVSNNTQMQEILKSCAKVAQSNSTVLILGESGTGKELIARGIHFNSKRQDKPFVAVNCPSIPSGLLESELFGHVKGAFTGALKDRIGRFEQADGGTIFLDEIGDLSPEVQAKLLRVLQEREFERVGDSRTISVNVRIVAATNRNIQSMVADNQFREDLYYRLSVVPVDLPPLRKRKDDVPYLVDHFIRKLRPGQKMKVSQELISDLQKYNWPGNIRELQNVVEHMVALAEGNELGVEDIPTHLFQKPQVNKTGGVEIPPEGLALAEIEKMAILSALDTAAGNQSRAAQLLDIPRHVLLYRMKKLNIE